MGIDGFPEVLKSQSKGFCSMARGQIAVKARNLAAFSHVAFQDGIPGRRATACPAEQTGYFRKNQEGLLALNR
jgi:hypothetical protein